MRAILFDFGGTLDYPGHWLDRFLRQYRSAGIDLSRAELDHAYDAATQTAYRAAESIRELGLARLNRYLVGLQIEELMETGPVSVRELLNSTRAAGKAELANRISEGFTRESLDGLASSRQIVAALGARFKIGIVSNFYGNLDRVLAETGWAQHVDAVADSSRVGISKPAAGIFHAALTQLKVAPREAAMVGDSLDKDCAPARRLGLTTVWLRHRGVVAKGVEGVLADFTIRDLAELEDLRWPD